MVPVTTGRTGRRHTWTALALYLLGVAAVGAVLALGFSAAWQGTFEWLMPQLTTEPLPGGPATP